MRADRRADSRKRHLAGLLAAVLAAGMLFVVPARADAPKKDGTSYEGYGKVEVEFEDRVDWKSPKVTVKNSAGKTCKVRILEREDDEIIFRIVNFVQGERYKYWCDNSYSKCNIAISAGGTAAPCIFTCCKYWD